LLCSGTLLLFCLYGARQAHLEYLAVTRQDGYLAVEGKPDRDHLRVALTYKLCLRYSRAKVQCFISMVFRPSSNDIPVVFAQFVSEAFKKRSFSKKTKKESFGEASRRSQRPSVAGCRKKRRALPSPEALERTATRKVHENDLVVGADAGNTKIRSHRRARVCGRWRGR
jgi:hypothetical protein